MFIVDDPDAFIMQSGWSSEKSDAFEFEGTSKFSSLHACSFFAPEKKGRYDRDVEIVSMALGVMRSAQW
jgi:hypothetical protein